MLTPVSDGLCTSGTAVGFDYDEVAHAWSWTCAGAFSGSDASCGADEFYCGDDIVNGSGAEACDDGNDINGDVCNNLCQFTIPGACGSVSGSAVYYFSNNGVGLNSNSPNLCST